MDILRKVLYTLTFPIWYVLSLLVGSKERPPCIEGSGSCEEKYPLPPIEKYTPDDSENVNQSAEDVVRAFGEDLAPAQFIDDEDEEDEEEEEDEEDEVLDDDEETGSQDQNENIDNLLPDSVKKATDSLQREIEETMKLRDELIAAADRNLQRVEALSGSASTQSSDQSGADKAQTVVKNLTEGATVAAEAAKDKIATAARSAQGKIDQAVQQGGEMVDKIAKVAANTEESLARSFQDELEEAEKMKKKAGGLSTTDRETLERVKAVEQAIRDDQGDDEGDTNQK